MLFYINAIYEYDSPEPETTYTAGQPYVSKYPEGDNPQIPQWKPYINGTTIVDGVPVYIYTWVTQDNILTIRVHVSPQNVLTGTGPLTPNDVKLDIEIHDYNFTGEQTRLALVTTLQSQHQSSSNTGADGIQNNNFYFGEPGALPPFGQFSWVPEAGNGTINVAATTSNLNYANQFNLYFSFLTDPQFIHSDIVWDPQLGLAYDYTPSPRPGFCLGSICGGGAIAILAVVISVAVVVIGVGAGCVLKPHVRGSYETIPSS